MTQLLEQIVNQLWLVASTISIMCLNEAVTQELPWWRGLTA